MWESHVQHGGMCGMEGTSGANHPLRGALISNYLIKICLRRGASYAPLEFVLLFFQRCTTVERGRVFKGSKVDLTSRHDGPPRGKKKRKTKRRVTRIHALNSRFLCGCGLCLFNNIFVTNVSFSLARIYRSVYSRSAFRALYTLFGIK